MYVPARRPNAAQARVHSPAAFVFRFVRMAGTLALACVLVLCTIPFFGTSSSTALADAASDEEARQTTHTRAAAIQLTDEEKAFVDACPVLRVGIFPVNAPMSYLDDSGQIVGVNRDVVGRIALETGLSFEFVELDESRNFMDQIDELDIDVVAGIEPVVLEGGYDLQLTEPYCLTRATVSFNSSYYYRDLRDSMTMAVTAERAAGYRARGYEVLACDSFADCLEAVNSGRATYTYENSYVTDYVMAERSYDDVSTVDATVQSVDYSLAVTSNAAPELLELLDKAIASITVADVIEMVYNHTYENRPLTLHELITKQPVAFMLIVAVPLLVLVVALGVVAVTRSRAANRDPLTQLFNGPAFRRRAQSRLRKEGTAQTRCLAVVDIDDFKSVNDRFGHYEGDVVLKRLADILRSSCRKGEYAARMGGDEFLLFWEGSDAGELTQRADAVLEAFHSDGIHTATGGAPLSASMGVACTHPDEDYDDLYRRADAALYRSKAAGKGAACIDEG